MTRTGTYGWVSAATERKERDFRGLLNIHVPVCASIRQRHGRATDPPYLFVDLHGGPGHLLHGTRWFEGSPLIAGDILTDASLPHESIHFERDPDTAGLLQSAVRDHPCATVITATFETGAAEWLAATAPHRYRYGLVYSDPIDKPLPVSTFNAFAAHFERVDLLAYVAANSQYKRPKQRRLADDVAAVDKRYVLIRESDTAHQWTFILWTNWDKVFDWHKRGFYRLDSRQGEHILDKLNTSDRDRHRRDNDPLPLEEATEPAPYRTYREYLRHPRFLRVRAEVFHRANGTCERCRRQPPVDAHHVRYPPWGEFDAPENLLALCRRCHADIHRKAA